MAREVTIHNVADMAYHFGSHGRTADLRAKGFPLVSGDPETVVKAGISAHGRVISEREAKDLEDHIVEWPSTEQADTRTQNAKRRRA